MFVIVLLYIVNKTSLRILSSLYFIFNSPKFRILYSLRGHGCINKFHVQQAIDITEIYIYPLQNSLLNLTHILIEIYC